MGTDPLPLLSLRNRHLVTEAFPDPSLAPKLSVCEPSESALNVSRGSVNWSSKAELSQVGEDRLGRLVVDPPVALGQGHVVVDARA